MKNYCVANVHLIVHVYFERQEIIQVNKHLI